jgi:hypothetical protein
MCPCYAAQAMCLLAQHAQNIHTQKWGSLQSTRRWSIHGLRVNLELVVPCLTLDEKEAVKCWSDDYSTKFVTGVIKNVFLNRRTKKP